MIQAEKDRNTEIRLQETERQRQNAADAQHKTYAADTLKQSRDAYVEKWIKKEAKEEKQYQDALRIFKGPQMEDAMPTMTPQRRPRTTNYNMIYNRIAKQNRGATHEQIIGLVFDSEQLFNSVLAADMLDK